MDLATAVILFFTVVSGLGALVYILDYFGLIGHSTMEERQNRGVSGLATIITLLLLTWVAVGYDFYDRHLPSPPTIHEVLTGWGTINGCAGTVDGSRLANWQDKYAVALVCGVNEASVDRFVDKRFTISSLYTIVSGGTGITVPYSKTMASAMAKMKRNAPQPPPPEQVAVSVWYAVVLLPKDVPVTEIVQLSDVSHRGGIILQGYAESPQI
jgi:hypothetical protein